MIKQDTIPGIFRFCWPLLAWLAMSSVAGAHGLPIFVSVNAATNQVEVSGTFDDAVVDGLFLSDVPGIGVLSEFSGVESGKTIRLRITQGLLFSNSEILEATNSKVTVYSAEFAQSVEVYESSVFPEDLDWAVYPSEAGVGWDSDGLFELGPGTPPAGVYGVVVQVMLAGTFDSEPFFIPVVHNPVDVEASKSAIEAAIVLPPTADFTRDWRVDGHDLAQWEANMGLFQTPGTAKVLGDADDDGDVDGFDFLRWQAAYGTTPNSITTGYSVPELPSSLLWSFAGIGWLSSENVWRART